MSSSSTNFDFDDLTSEALKRWGISELYPPQKEVISRGLHLDGNFLLASATASGKTLVAELAMLKEVLEEKKAIYIAPLRAVASEKFKEIETHLGAFGCRVRLSIGDYDSSEEPLARYDVIVTTYEKFDSILRHVPSWLDDVGIAVFDEIHYLDDPERGPTVEMTVVKFMDQIPDARRIALSATVTNADEIGSWLDARTIKSSWRPVPLRLGVYFDEKIYFCSGDVIETPHTGDCILDIFNTDTLSGQMIVFCNQRRRTVALANRLAKRFNFSPSEKLHEAAEKLRKIEPQSPTVEKLSKVLTKGVAFHHAGLSHDVREMVEHLFRERLVSILVATPTLVAGVNLPAKTVIVRDMRRYFSRTGRMNYLPVSEVKQMLGRAGRPLFDRIGYGIVVARSEEERDFFLERYLAGDPEPIISKLNNPDKLRSQVLSLICLKSPCSPRDIEVSFRRTLFFRQRGGSLRGPLRSAIDFLLKNGFIEDDYLFRVTKIGRRVSELYIDPYSSAIMLRNSDLLRERSDLAEAACFIVALTPDMPRLSVGSRDKNLLEERTGDLFDMLDGMDLISDLGWDVVYSALKSTMVLKSWVEEVPEGIIERELGVESGDVHRIVESASWLLYAFAEVLRAKGEEDLCDDLKLISLRVRHGVREELLDLIRITDVGRVRARVLFNAGYRSVSDISEARPEDIAQLSGFGIQLAKKIIENAKKILGRCRFTP